MFGRPTLWNHPQTEPAFLNCCSERFLGALETGGQQKMNHFVVALVGHHKGFRFLPKQERWFVEENRSERGVASGTLSRRDLSQNVKTPLKRYRDGL